MFFNLTNVIQKLSGSSPEARPQRIIIVRDDSSQPNRAYLVCPAATISAEEICFLVNHGRGIIFAALDEARIRALGLTPMTSKADPQGLDLTVSVESRRGVSTGISAADRALTLQTIANTLDAKLDLVTPGHIFPLRAKLGGVLVRSDIAEAAVDLLTICKLTPVAALSHCLNEAGDFLSEAELQNLGEQLKLPEISISDIIRYRLSSESIVEKIAEAKLPTEFAGEFKALCFRSRTDGSEHLVLVKGDLSERDSQAPVLVRVQSEHELGDLFGFQNLLSRQRIRGALRKISEEGTGVFVYVRHSRKNGLHERARNFFSPKTAVKSTGEFREFGIGAQILRSLGIEKIKLLSNTQRDLSGIPAFNLTIIGRVGFEELS